MRSHEFEIHDPPTKVGAKKLSYVEEGTCWWEGCHPVQQCTLPSFRPYWLEDISSVSREVKMQKGSKSRGRIILDTNLFWNMR